MRQNESVFDVAAAREAWSEMITQYEADKLVFLDEIRYLGRTPANALLESFLPWSAQIQKIVKHLE